MLFKRAAVTESIKIGLNRNCFGEFYQNEFEPNDVGRNSYTCDDKAGQLFRRSVEERRPRRQHLRR
jgi:hypothetical protein